MKILFFGTPEFSIAPLEACFSLGEILAVVTQPDKPFGRGREIRPSPTKQWALRHRVPVLQPLRIKEVGALEELQGFQADIAVVAAYGQLLPPKVLGFWRGGCINVHASLLPRWRGASPIARAIEAGDKETGVCLMRMEEGLDTGPLFARSVVSIGAQETAQSLHGRLSQEGARLLLEHLPAIIEGGLPAQPQPEEGVVLAPRLKKAEGELDFRQPAFVLERRIRAFCPWPGCYTWLRGQRLLILEAKTGQGRGEVGQLLASVEGFEIACAEGSLVVERLKPDSRAVLGGRAFLLGQRLEPGVVFGREGAR
ncbi:MAG: methionyl-tRNA formyltransferase [Proteobacteria bacterium]|nr:methionyl-tRNA formyltransferase [Cystobacterineae bacterium]MCL2259690.1 methionyl-tRNA formyltransferase [Cystobacterineae bacterium]MCL2313693.1 methionyl-tRNA formyltransferase [Pseudomonadota bacterium]